MKRQLLALKKQFKPYYIVYLSQLPKPGFKEVKCYRWETICIKFQPSKDYICHEYIDFNTFVKKTLAL